MRSRVFILGLFAACFSSLAASRADADGGFNVIVNAKNGVESLSRSDVKRLVLGSTKSWGSGTVVQLGMIPADAPETEYLASLLGMSTHELISAVQQQVFKGELRRPVVLRSSADCLSLATGSAGAICVAAASAAVPSGARVVPVQ